MDKQVTVAGINRQPSNLAKQMYDGVTI